MDKITRRFFDIVSGPDRDVLFDALEHAHDKDVTVTVDFTVAFDYIATPDNPKRFLIPLKIADIKITSITHTDDSGNHFSIRGRCEADLDSSENVDATHESYKPYTFVGFYGADKHEGYLILRSD